MVDDELRKKDWKIAMLEDDVAEMDEEIGRLKAEIEWLKASRERLRIYGKAAFRYVTTPYFNDDDPDGYRHFADLMGAQMQLEPGDLADLQGSGQ